MKCIQTDLGRITARDVVDGIAIDPKLPRGFNNKPNDQRPASHHKFWYRPFIETETVEAMDAFYAERTDEYADKGREHWQTYRPRWLAAYPTGTCYEVRCLDGSAWDRPTSWGMFATLAQALACVKGGAA